MPPSPSASAPEPWIQFQLDTRTRDATVWPFPRPLLRAEPGDPAGSERRTEGGRRVLIPISHEDQQVSRLPWVTIALVAANVVIFLATLPLADRQILETRNRIQEVLRFAVEHPYLQMPEELAPALRGMRLPAMPPRSTLSPETIADEQAQLDRLWSEVKAATSVSVLRRYGYVPAEPNPLALFTSMFMHAGWLHLLGNMLFLWLSGGSLEDRWGRTLFVILYLVSGVVATLIHAAMTPQSHLPLVGASGAIAGLMGAFLIRLTTARIRFFYWIFFFRGTFAAPAWVMLPLWLLQQLFMARTGTEGGVAVWAHIGGFVFGAMVATVILLTNMEGKVLTPAVKKKTTWEPSERLTAALEKLDRGDVDGAIKILEALIRTKPDDIDARTSLVDARVRKGDLAAASKDSVRLVSSFLKARDMAGATAAAKDHRQAFPDVPLLVRDQLALAADCEKRKDLQGAAVRYQEAIASGPDEPLAPKALVGYGRLLLQAFKQPAEALEVLERARTHPRATLEFQKVSADMIASAKETMESAPEPPGAESQAAAPEPAQELPHQPSAPEVPTSEEPVEPAPAAPPDRSLAPAPVRGVGIDARGLMLEDRQGKTGHLPWQKVMALSVASIGQPGGAGQDPDALILDLITGSDASPPDG